MTIFGIDLVVIVFTFGFFGLGVAFHKMAEYDRKVSKQLYQARIKAMRAVAKSQKAKALRERKSEALPPAFREENWNRCFYGEPTDEDAILASTGCQLTDAIFHAAHEAGIDIVSFYRQPLSDLLNGQISHEVGCENSGIDQKQRCLG